MAEQDLLKGNTLALEAIAEQLQKSNDLSAQLAARFAKEDEEKSEVENEEAEAIAKAAFTKEIVKAVGDAFGFAKGAEAPTGDSAAGMPVDDYNPKHVSSDATPPAADTQEDANIDNSTETAQQPLEAGEATSYSALQKQGENGMIPGMEENGSDEYPQVEEGPDGCFG